MCQWMGGGWPWWYGYPGCTRQTFREQVPDVLERYQRRTPGPAARYGRRWELLFGPGVLVSDFLAQALTEERFRTATLVAERFRSHAPDVDPRDVYALAHATSGSAEQLGRW